MPYFLTIQNLTTENLTVRFGGNHSVVVTPNVTNISWKVHKQIAISPCVDSNLECDKSSPSAMTWYVRLKGTASASWRIVPVPDNCPWRIYHIRVSLGYYIYVHFFDHKTRCGQSARKHHHQLMIFQNRNLSSFLSKISDNVPLSALTLPGKFRHTLPKTN
jgi:1-phosphatidylinositol phosphodiesterase